MNYLCFDIGGTFIKYGIITNDGAIISQSKIKTPTENCKESIPKALIEVINQVVTYDDSISAIGISSAGQIDSSNGKVIFAMDTIPDYTGCNLVDSLKEVIDLPVYVENDAKCACLGELWIGAGKSYNNFICLTLGTGVGGAIVIDRKIYNGINNCAGDFGKLTVESDILKGSSYFDHTGSTKSLIERYKTITNEVINGREIMELVKKGDTNANIVYYDFIKSLVTGIKNIAYILSPEAIVIGGGISAQGGYFFERLNSDFYQLCIGQQRYCSIVKAELENTAGLVGAAYLCVQ